MNTLGRFIAMSATGDNVCDVLFALRHAKALSANSKKKSFASKFFTLRIDPFSEGRQNKSHKRVAF